MKPYAKCIKKVNVNRVATTTTEKQTQARFVRCTVCSIASARGCWEQERKRNMNMCFRVFLWSKGKSGKRADFEME